MSSNARVSACRSKNHTDSPPVSMKSLRRSDPMLAGPSMWNASVSTGVVVMIGSRISFRAFTHLAC